MSAGGTIRRAALSTLDDVQTRAMLSRLSDEHDESGEVTELEFNEFLQEAIEASS